jgi:hypothetical protein
VKRTSTFLGETTDRSEAMGLDTLRSITIRQSENGRVFTATRRRTCPANSGAPTRTASKAASTIQEIVMNWPSSMQHTFTCNGHEGSSKGRRIGRPCMNGFEVTLVKD